MPGPRYNVADHKQVWGVRQRFELRDLETLDQLDPQRGQLVTHRGIDAGIASSYGKARLARDCCQAAHEGAANAQNMYMHIEILGADLCRQRAQYRYA